MPFDRVLDLLSIVLLVLAAALYVALAAPVDSDSYIAKERGKLEIAAASLMLSGFVGVLSARYILPLF